MFYDYNQQLYTLYLCHTIGSRGLSNVNSHHASVTFVKQLRGASDGEIGYNKDTYEIHAIRPASCT